LDAAFAWHRTCAETASVDAFVFALAHFSCASTRPKALAPPPTRRNAAIQMRQSNVDRTITTGMGVVSAFPAGCRGSRVRLV
jgi:hypothetical protein